VHGNALTESVTFNSENIGNRLSVELYSAPQISWLDPAEGTPEQGRDTMKRRKRECGKGKKGRGKV